MPFRLTVPKLQLTSVALRVNELIVTVNNSGQLRAVVNNVLRNTCPAVVAGAVEVVKSVKSIRLITACAVVSKNTLNVLALKSMEIALALGVSAAVTGGGSLTGCGSHRMAECLTCGLTTASGTGCGLGTGCGCEVVSDDACAGSITYFTYRNVSTLGIAVIVAESRKSLVIGMLADGTYIGHEAVSGTGSLGAGALVGVAECGNHGNLGGVLLTYGTYGAGAVACIGTGGSLSGNLNLGVTESGNNLLCLGHLAAYGTLNAGGETGLGTGGSDAVNGNVILVTGSGNEIKSAARAASTGISGITVSRTGGSGGRSCRPGVHMSIEHPRACDSIAEGDIVDKNTAAFRSGITGNVYAVNTVGSSGELSYRIADILAVNVVIESNGVGLNVKNDTHHNVKPTGELILGVGNVLLVKNETVPTGSSNYRSALLVYGGRSKKEGLLGDTPVGAPSGAARAAINELHTEVTLSPV